MRRPRQLFVFALVVAMLASAVAASAAPKATAGLRELPENCLIRGSAHKGGIQPDYLIRADDKELQPLLRYAERIGNNTKLDTWTKVEKIRRKVRSSLPYREYDARPYLRLLADYRRRGEPVPIGKYSKLGVGVCREYAIMTVMALNKAGISAKFGYAKVKVGPTKSEALIEDHGFAVIERGRDKWVVDAYSPYFNGHRLRDLMRDNGPTRRAKLSPNVAEKDRSTGFRQILRINRFPSIRPLRSGARAAARTGKVRSGRARSTIRQTPARRSR